MELDMKGDMGGENFVFLSTDTRGITWVLFYLGQIITSNFSCGILKNGFLGGFTILILPYDGVLKFSKSSTNQGYIFYRL